MAAKLVRYRWSVRDLLQLPVPEGIWLNSSPFRLLPAAGEQENWQNSRLNGRLATGIWPQPPFIASNLPDLGLFDLSIISYRTTLMS